MKGVFFVADNNGVTCVVAAVELNDIVDVLGQKVGCLTLTFVAPLRTDDYNCRHDYPLQNLGFVRDGVHLSLSLEDVLHNPLVHGYCGGSRSIN